MGAILKVSANGTTTSPIIRGAWVLDRILGTPPPKPTVDVEAVEPDIRGATTIREQLAKHRHDAACAACHVKIDPPGLALENFDVIGGWRERYRSVGEGEPAIVDGQRMKYRLGPPVDASDVLPDGREFRNIDDYKQLILDDRDQLARSLAGLWPVSGPISGRETSELRHRCGTDNSRSTGNRSHRETDSRQKLRPAIAHSRGRAKFSISKQVNNVAFRSAKAALRSRSEGRRSCPANASPFNRDPSP